MPGWSTYRSVPWYLGLFARSSLGWMAFSALLPAPGGRTEGHGGRRASAQRPKTEGTLAGRRGFFVGRTLILVASAPFGSRPGRRQWHRSQPSQRVARDDDDRRPGQAAESHEPCA